MSGTNINNASNIANNGSAIAGATGAYAADFVTTLANPGVSPYWLDRLRPASFRGIPFGVLGSTIRFGRRNALHQYPLRDSVWVEDMGRGARRITLEGFLVGDDVIAQREKLIAACETPGDGKLVHSTLGEITVALLDAESEEQWDHGRVFKIRFSFVEGGQRVFPSVTTSTGDVVANAANNAGQKNKESFSVRVAQALRNGAATVQAAANTAAAYSRNMQMLVNDAANIRHLVQDAGSLLQATPGQTYGRRFNGGPPASSSSQVLTQQQITAAGSAARTNFNASVANLATAANNLSASTTDAFCAAAQGLVAAALAASPNPADGLRLMSSAAVFAPAVLPNTDPIGIGINTVIGASADLFRRSAVIAMARAAAAYQPLSYDDAANVRTWVGELLDDENDIAGDQNEDAVFNALFDVRTAITQDLAARGASLARMEQLSVNSPLPAVVLAYRLYGDISRADQLIEFAKPVHPAFMPTSMRILSS